METTPSSSFSLTQLDVTLQTFTVEMRSFKQGNPEDWIETLMDIKEDLQRNQHDLDQKTVEQWSEPFSREKHFKSLKVECLRIIAMIWIILLTYASSTCYYSPLSHTCALVRQKLYMR